MRKWIRPHYKSTTVPPVPIPNPTGGAMANTLSPTTFWIPCSPDFFHTPAEDAAGHVAIAASQLLFLGGSSSSQQSYSCELKVSVSWGSKNAVGLFTTACYPRIGRNKLLFVSTHWIYGCHLIIQWPGSVFQYTEVTQSIPYLNHIDLNYFLYLSSVTGLEYTWYSLCLQLENYELRSFFI